MREDLGNHGGIFDGGEDRQGAATVGTLFNIDSKHPFEQPGISLMRASAEGGGASPWSANLSLASGASGKPGTGTVPVWRPEEGMISECNLVLGASTPGERRRWSRGRGTSAARRCMNSRGDITIGVVPSRCAPHAGGGA